jgi:hypothetical protein
MKVESWEEWLGIGPWFQAHTLVQFEDLSFICLFSFISSSQSNCIFLLSVMPPPARDMPMVALTFLGCGKSPTTAPTVDVLWLTRPRGHWNCNSHGNT